MSAPSLINWFNRTCGQWRSERRYFFSSDGKPVNYTTMMDIHEGDRGNEFVINWTGKTSGTMRVSVDGSYLRRDRDYFGDEATDSEVELLDPDTIVTRTTYGGVTYREEIRLLSHDQYRLRQTFGSKPDGSFALCGQYIEFRLS